MHFNQQLHQYEQNERHKFEEKLTNLQKAYNELKFTHQKMLDNELGGLRLKLSESQQYASQLQAQLQLIKSNRSSSLSSNSSQPNIDLKDVNNNTNNADLINYLKRLKHENNELKIQIESERRRFNMEKEKWYLQFHSCMQNKRNSVNISTDNLLATSNLLYSSANPKASSSQGHQMGSVVTVNSSAHNSGPSKFQKKPFIKNVMFNQQHFL